jgi:hypothetical protein
LVKSKNILDWFQERSADEEVEVPEIVLLEQFLLHEELNTKFQIHKNYAFAHMILPLLRDKIVKTKKIGMTKNEERVVVKHSFDVDGKPVEIIELTAFAGETGMLTKAAERNSEIFALTKDITFRELTNIIFEELGNIVYLKKHEEKNHAYTLSKTTIDETEFYVMPEEKLAYLASEITQTRELGLQRSYLLNGEPGTGKTKFCMKLIQSFNARAVKIDPDVLSYLTGDNMKEFISFMGVDFIMFDDIDRVDNSQDSTFLFCLESLKYFPNKPCLLATSNDLYELSSAVLRPGRFEDIVMFEPPNPSERTIFFKEYFKREGIKIKIKDLNEIVGLTEGMTQAYLAEYALQVKLNQTNIPAVIQKITRRRKLIEDRYKS